MVVLHGYIHSMMLVLSITVCTDQSAITLDEPCSMATLTHVTVRVLITITKVDVEALLWLFIVHLLEAFL